MALARPGKSRRTRDGDDAAAGNRDKVKDGGMMDRFRVVFHKLRHDSRDYGSDDKYIVSRVFFSLEKDGEALGEFSADLKQAIGRNIEIGGIEVGPLMGFDDSFNHKGFSDAARKYFTVLIASKGAGIGAMAQRNIRIRNNLFAKDTQFSF